MQTKICTRCTKEKPATSEYFSKHPKGKFGLRSICKHCKKIEHAKKYRENRESILVRQKQYYAQNKEKILLREKKYRKNNQSKINERGKKYNKKRYHSDPEYRITRVMRARMYEVLIGKVKSKSTLELLGCSPSELREYLESLFQDGMTWENYGNPNGDHSHCWHIDHIKPCASFDLTDPDQQKECFHYSNLQPLWSEDNFKKSNTWDKNETANTVQANLNG